MVLSGKMARLLGSRVHYVGVCMAQRKAFRRHRKTQPSWKKEVLEDIGKRDETPSAVRGVLSRAAKGQVLVASKPQVLLGSSLKRQVLR